MHEWSVADSIIRALINWANENNVKEIEKVKVGIPSFTFLEVDILKEAFDTMKKGSVILDNATLEVKFKDPTFKCRNCDNVFTIDQVKDQLDKVRSEYGEEYPLHLIPSLASSFLTCPRCVSHDVVVQLDDITIDEIVVREGGTIKTVG
ncbi:hydrogenase expression/synthesis, HypA [Sulfolobus sp. A20]|uniref:hydrogenase maturation nickel metallochaperone HypA/HybF n=1 Tax=Sulfolobaceae TaxID=118883 RepID=UPI00084600D9|nr:MULTISPECIES: hydrogenase maturation nickel metallochaperone HypA [unclassified Sulfolobus]TRM74341.1 hydrogenase maturation nickel metallochaperone HypA [Sulfolobus sp. E5]TRM82285.1 hydrogenase maturation nickel metallochaperone HypA [Sulfolobus sp. D5]TRM85170.1 hydrogenase maturation nickel metallochaperone HypA [Sulfolobus sp. F3]TRM87821.1 hydrogenase maturation nickel metallochaperone HypA [Sulfolobus sp. E3]TRN00718.1 hydrogenase maturation nickel metallochaperone HypA [Sulfolobus s